MLVDVSSKAARLHRRQAAKRKRYARLRKAGRVPQHTQAERRLAAAERERQREADQRREAWLRRGVLPVTLTLTAAAASVVIGAGHPTGVVQRFYHPYTAAAQLYPYAPSRDSGDPDLPHLPEPDATFYTAYAGSGTAVASVHILPGVQTW
jgi:hypothetical protein